MAEKPEPRRIHANSCTSGQQRPTPENYHSSTSMCAYREDPQSERHGTCDEPLYTDPLRASRGSRLTLIDSPQL
ncbi:Hypothetical predicted protein [Pelobates cultripes]|uniref:Uncharacterized protein n=1 Tax=Pelobates cultripes TaxID=61616 RepID=A0AAD1TL49_PELCU|nr:Hypothetical predicted protein [Pelobates cultripes]